MASRKVAFIVFVMFFIVCSDINNVVMVTNADPFGLCSHDANIGECRIADGKQLCHCKSFHA
ncbi:hypothetical protein C5167_013300 [Papaver somniferum]|uniref:Uncharacterized protein n=1 Tax=Papaver somniferum TaxID=3469 RepID=A0A4Y7IZV4_PAPSO|nr:hypothetical protein C5167_013300 [Papaver somniferum]